MYLENINSPEDVKRLSFENLNILADEIRHALLTKLSALADTSDLTWEW